MPARAAQLGTRTGGRRLMMMWQHNRAASTGPPDQVGWGSSSPVKGDVDALDGARLSTISLLHLCMLLLSAVSSNIHLLRSSHQLIAGYAVQECLADRKACLENMLFTE